MTAFVILHASDLHLSDPPYRAPRRALSRFFGRSTRAWKQAGHDAVVFRAFAQFAFQFRKQYDALLITGDLATTGSQRDLGHAYQFVSGSAPTPSLSFLRPPAGQPPNRVFVLPGNHDRYRSSPTYLPGGRRFDTIFAPAAPAAPFWSVGQGIEQPLTLTKGPHTLHVLRADFTLRRGDKGRRHYWLPGWFGQGRVYAPVIQQLVAQTRQLLQPNATILWAVHFDPFASDPTLQLLTSERLVEAALDEKIPAILCGHTHESKFKPLSRETAVYACGSTCQVNSPQGNDLQVLKVTVPDAGGTPTLRALWFRYDDKSRQFRHLMSR